MNLWAAIQRDDNISNVTIEHTYATSIEDLWDALTNPERAQRWLGTVSGDLHQGGKYLISFSDVDETQRTSGTVTRCSPPDGLTVTWFAPGDAGETVVDVTLTQEPLGTTLRLIQTGLAPSADAEHAAGWQVHLEMLEQSLSGAVRVDSWDAWEPLCTAYSQHITN